MWIWDPEEAKQLPVLDTISLVFLWLSMAGALVIAVDILGGHRQRMGIMNVVWPVTALWSGPFGLWAYFAFGRNQDTKERPFWITTVIADLHCAAGCTVGDMAGEWIVFLSSFTIAGSALWSGYLTDFTLAYVLGIVFQYFSIAPMRHISGTRGIIAAMKADTVSLVSFEVGMFAWMALTHVVLFKPPLKPTAASYWFMMQIAMAVGFMTAYPANRWLIRSGVKEAM